MAKAVIFDMDGVISDTQEFQATIEESVLKKYGANLSSDEITKKYAGVSDKFFFSEIFKDSNIKTDPSIAIKEKWDLVLQKGKNNIKPIPFTIDLIKTLKRENYKLAVASASIKEFIELVLSELKINKYFDAITSSREVKKGKPAPDVFILAAKKLNVSPIDCVVIEDGLSGIIGAGKAGMKTIFLNHHKRTDVKADLIISNMKELSPQKIESLIQKP
jgi:HAD superfamily hydrolase (TIGR01509 family)